MTTPQAETEALLPCPFCQHPKPIVGQEDGRETWAVSCGNEKCLVSLWDDDRPSAIAAWNTRAALTPKPLSVAPEDEALIDNVCAAQSEVMECIEFPDSVNYRRAMEKKKQAKEALRRRIAELRAEMAMLQTSRSSLRIRAEDAEINLKAKQELLTTGSMNNLAEHNPNARWYIGHCEAHVSEIARLQTEVARRGEGVTLLAKLGDQQDDESDRLREQLESEKLVGAMVRQQMDAANARAETAESALAACRDKTIEECAVAIDFPSLNIPTNLSAAGLCRWMASHCAKAIRALKSKENGNG